MNDDADSIRALLRKADQALDDAAYLLNDERAEAAVNRAYYAAYHAACAALLTEGETPNTHAGVLARFSYHFIRTGRISEDMGRVLARIHKETRIGGSPSFLRAARQLPAYASTTLV